MRSSYLFKHFNFISSYDGIFNNFNFYKFLYSNAYKHLKIMYKHFFKTCIPNTNNLLNKVLIT